MAIRVPLKNLTLESRYFKYRAVWAGVLVTVAICLLAGWLYRLQISNHEHYQTRSNDNRVRVFPVPPSRGLIYDRYGELIAYNKPNYQLEITPSKVDDLEVTLERLGEIIALDDYDVSRFRKDAARKQAFQKVPVRFNLSDQEVARFAANQYAFSGVGINARATRFYVGAEDVVHALGYVGRVNEKELQQVDQNDYSGTTHIGKLGIEKRYEEILHGSVGYQSVEINAQGRTLRVLQTTPPVAGSDLKLTIDRGLNRVAMDALGEENGAVVALDPNNGDVLVFVSKPAYDPNLFVNGIGQKAYSALRDDANRPLFNRALTGQYPPGSTIKPLVALAGLEYELIWSSKTLYAGPYFQLPGRERRYRDWKKGGHGLVDLHKAIMRSVDVYFYDLAHQMGIERLDAFLEQFNLGAVTGLDTVGEASGILPSPEWKRETRGQVWFPGETVITGIGQGYMLTTPIQLAVLAAQLAKRGHTYRPRFVSDIRASGAAEFQPVEPVSYAPIEVSSEQYWDDVINAMVAVVHEPRGTASRIAEGITYTMAGKTGTAQVFGIGQDEEYDEEKIAKKLRDHGLFVAFAPVEDPQIAIGVVVENGGSGSGAAAPVARKVMDAYLAGINIQGEEVASSQ